MLSHYWDRAAEIFLMPPLLFLEHLEYDYIPFSYLLDAPTPILRPRIGFFKVEPAMSQFRVVAALRPPVPDAVTECSPSPKGRPAGPRAQRSNGISSLAFISCLFHTQIPLRASRCPAPNASSRCCSSQNISPAPGAARARQRNLLGTRSRTSPSTTAVR